MKRRGLALILAPLLATIGMGAAFAEPRSFDVVVYGAAAAARPPAAVR